MKRHGSDSLRRPRGLTPLVGAAMAAVAASSLVMFSLLAEEVVGPQPDGVALQPRSPYVSRGDEALTVPPPAPERDLAQTPPGGATGVILAATAPFSAEGEARPPVTNEETPAPAKDYVGSAYLGYDVQTHPRTAFRGPHNHVTVTPPAKQSEHGCPPGPFKPRPAGGHPHGGPPACGNPHGGPPGQARERDTFHASPGGTPGGPHEDSSSAGRPSEQPGASGGPPGKPARRPRPAGDGDSGPGPGGPPRGSPGSGRKNPDDAGYPQENGGGSGGHPHGAPPGQSKKESGGEGASPPPDEGHPQGGPPGQKKKK